MLGSAINWRAVFYSWQSPLGDCEDFTFMRASRQTALFSWFNPNANKCFSNKQGKFIIKIRLGCKTFTTDIPIFVNRALLEKRIENHKLDKTLKDVLI